MFIGSERGAGIGVALNEASLLGVEYDPARKLLATTVSVLTLPDDHSLEPVDPRRQIVFTEVGRIAAALRNGWWYDLSAEVIPFQASELLSVVQSFGGGPVYGWDFINAPDSAFEHWKRRLSLDLSTEQGSQANQLQLFQEGAASPRHLDLWVWFSDLLIRDAEGNAIELEDSIEGGRRWWDAMFAGDPRTQGHGIVAGGPANRSAG